mmetsp:Transcript_42983/g.69870  ORF Transcript_42983/g.69870 Transcript_42983/m.69870 type:complete len:500 (+) Transcript_42983:21-1520(+)
MGMAHVLLTLCLWLASAQELSLQNWMGGLAPAIKNLSILDLALPGTHDTMTYDLSRRISDGANDLPPSVSWILHEIAPILGIAEVGQFIRSQAVTQRLNITEQLENGVRFLDFRIMYTAGPESGSLAQHDWYCLHLVETNQKSMLYLRALKAFLDAHESEVVVIWLSRHGSSCKSGNDQYPGVSAAVKQQFWSTFRELFGGYIFDPSRSRLNATTYAELITTGQRLVVYASDHSEFTGGDERVYDACTHLSNTLKGGDLTDIPGSISSLRTEFASSAQKRAQLKANDQLYLLSMAGSPPASVTTDAAKIKYLPLAKDSIRKKCAALFRIPNMTDWCPETLGDAEQLRNYYLQAVLEEVAVSGNETAAMAKRAALVGGGGEHEGRESSPVLSLPGAIYLDALDYGGLIRTGIGPLEPHTGEENGVESGNEGYSYIDTLLLFNARAGCASLREAKGDIGADNDGAEFCQKVIAQIQARRARNPARSWNDPAHGRLLGWPHQ